MSRKPRMVPEPADGARIPRDAEVIGIDPGLQHPAAARMSRGRIIAAQRTCVPSGSYPWIGQRCLKIAGWIAQWVRDTGRGLPSPDYVVLEWPQWYRETKAQGVDPNDLGGILGVGSTAIGLIAAEWPGVAVLTPTPAQAWSGIPKSTSGDPWASKRGQRVKARVSADELAVIESNHDSVDAAGLCLWATGRFERHRVFPGAS